MSRVITFSRYFPAYHPKKGQQTDFIEKIWNGLQDIGYSEPLYFFDELMGLSSVINKENYNTAMPKFHTIRSGKRWKVGDKFSPRVWSGKPYTSPMITIAPDIEIKSVQDFKIEVDKDYICILIDGKPFYEENSKFTTNDSGLEFLAKSDGLLVEELKAWFKWGNPFDGQIICWNENIKY